MESGVMGWGGMGSGVFMGQGGDTKGHGVMGSRRGHEVSGYGMAGSWGQAGDVQGHGVGGYGVRGHGMGVTGSGGLWGSLGVPP